MMNAFPGGKNKLSTLEQFNLLKDAGFDGAEPSSPVVSFTVSPIRIRS